MKKPLGIADAVVQREPGAAEKCIDELELVVGVHL
jgi:hypothetical protein